MKDPEENINYQVDKSFRNRNQSRGNRSRDSQDRDRKVSRRSNRPRKSSGDRSNDRARNGRNDSKQESNKHCEYCNQDGHTWKYCWEMQANAKKAKKLKDMDDRDGDSSDTCNSMVSQDSISGDDLDGLIRNVSEM